MHVSMKFILFSWNMALGPIFLLRWGPYWENKFSRGCEFIQELQFSTDVSSICLCTFLNHLSIGTTWILLSLVSKLNDINAWKKYCFRHKNACVHRVLCNLWQAFKHLSNPGLHRLLICNASAKSIYQCTDSGFIFRPRVLQKARKMPCFYLPFLHCIQL